jgi:predicted acylesterase/phospholipase RssA
VLDIEVDIMRALVLSGGGALGAFEAGAIKALSDANVSFDLICGTSIGAINASFAAQGKVTELDNLWRTISLRKPPVVDYIDTVRRVTLFADDLDKVARGDLLELPGLGLRWMQIGSKRALLALLGIAKPDAIQDILSQNLRFDDVKTSLIITVTNLTYGASEAFYAFVGDNCSTMQTAFLAQVSGRNFHELTTDENFVLAVRSSAAIPAFFEPVGMNLGVAGDKKFVDGGVANNIPVSLATKAGATDIVVIQLQPSSANVQMYQTNNMLDIVFACYTVMQQQLLEQNMELVRATSGVKIKCIRPPTVLPLSLLEFENQPAINKAFDMGYAAAQAQSE